MKQLNLETHIKVRMRPDHKDLIRRAAAHDGVGVSVFTRLILIREARRILGEERAREVLAEGPLHDVGK